MERFGARMEREVGRRWCLLYFLPATFVWAASGERSFDEIKAVI